MTVRQNRFSVGDIIDGKYEVVRVLPAGGMGELYKVRHIHLNDFRAVKVLKSQMLTDATQKQRFLREAKIAASIKHPNLASLFDFSSLPDGSYYMVQEFIDGVTLIETINAGEIFDVPFILRVGQQVLGGLASLHEEGIIHRDISPDNLMLTKTNSGSTTIKIIDLGIAKPIDAGEGLTNAGFFVGKLHYASPEQAGMIEPGEKVDRRTDLYSLGVVLYQMVARRMPFAADNPQSYFLKQVSEEVAPINRLGEPPLVPVELEQFILRMLRKNRNERFASATEALNELVMLSARLSTVAPSFVPEDTGRNARDENPPLGGYIATEAGDDTDLFGNPVDAPVFSSSLGSTPLGQSSQDRTTAELPLINSFPSVNRTDELDLSPQPSSSSTPETTGDFPFDDSPQPPAIETDAVNELPTVADAQMSEQARAIFSLDQQPTTVQEIQSFPTQMDASGGQVGTRTIMEPVPSPGSYGAPPISPKTMMQDDTVTTLDSPMSASGTVVQNIGPQGSHVGTAAPVYPPAAGMPMRPVKRKSGAIWVVLALVVLLLGAALFAALRFLPFSPFAADSETTTTIADASTATDDPGGLPPIVPVETPTPTPESTPIVDPLDLITQTAVGMGTTMGPDFVPTPTPRTTPRPRITPRATPTPARTESTPPPTPPPATPVPVREGELVEQGSAGVTDARISKWSPPRYPRGAERQRAEGTTTLRVLVGPGGEIEDVRVSTSSGFKILDDEAINVARKSNFAPATKNGVRVRMWIPVRVSFQRP